MADNQFNNMDDDDVHMSVEAADDAPNIPDLSQNATVDQVQRRTFSHWPHSSRKLINRMCRAGFYGCNINDRVICVHCGLVCHGWITHIDEPWEIHRNLSPSCSYVRSILLNLRSPPPPPVINTSLSSTVNVAIPPISTSLPINSVHYDEIVPKFSGQSRYDEIHERRKSFASWPKQNLPSVDDLVQAGFFYTGTKTTVTCFYCNESLHDWGSNDNPMIEHARWFPHCSYARQLCGDDLYRKIQESQRPRQERPRANEWREINFGNRSDASILTINRLLLTPDESILPRLVAARLDLPVSQRLINTNFRKAIVKQCWEDQLKIKEEDFVSEADLVIACTILQKQIESINGNGKNIIIPSERIRQIRQLEEIYSRQALAAELVSRNVTTSASTTRPNHQHSITTASSSSSSIHDAALQTTAAVTATEQEGSPDNSIPSNPCVLCFTEEKRLACIPCGHLVTCVSCGNTLRLCPICRRDIEAFIKIFT